MGADLGPFSEELEDQVPEDYKLEGGYLVER